LRVPFAEPAGTRHVYDNATTFILARMVERVTGRDLPEWLDERLFAPMGIEGAEWDRVASGAAFGFHGLHLTTEAVAAFGELLRCGGRWGDRQLVPREWVELATRPHIATLPAADGSGDVDYLGGYGYQFWISRHGYHGDGSFGQLCIVVPSHDLVVAATGAHTQAQLVLDAVWDCLLPDQLTADGRQDLSLPMVQGLAGGSGTATIDASPSGSALPDGTTVVVEPVDGGWLVRLGDAIGHGTWRESSPLGRPVVAAGAWQGTTYVADLYLITTPHRVRLTVNGPTATATWNLVPLTTADLALHLQAPLMTRPDVA
jgi:CubicO group peptidase (beta-lactamase class C family)